MLETHQLVYMVSLFVLFTSGFVPLFLAIVECFSGYCVNNTKLRFLYRRIFGKHTGFFFFGGGVKAGKTLPMELF